MEEPESTQELAGSSPPDDHELSFEDAIEQELAPPAERRVTYIDDLPDAVEVDHVLKMIAFKVNVGDQVVVEKWMAIAGTRRWLGTVLYRVTEVDAKTGNVRLYDEENKQSAATNFVTAVLKHGWRFKLPVPKLNLHAREKAGFDPPKAPTDTGTGGAGPSTQELAGDSNEKHKRAPRRPQHIVDAEKKERLERGKARRLRREARQRGEKV